MRYKVPQNIDMQDRIVGPLTMVQFVYAIIGGGICYTVFMTLPAPFSYILVAPIAAFTIGVSFVKINERPFLAFFSSALQFVSSPKQRIWHHQYVDNMKVTIYQDKKHDDRSKLSGKALPQDKLHQIAEKMDAN